MALLTNINGKFSVSDAGAVTFNNAFTFPTADGTANYVLKTNGSGQLSWSPDNNNGDITGSGTANTVTKFTGAKTIGDGPITFSSNDSTFAGQVIASSSSSGDYVRIYGGSGTAQWDIYGNGENLRFSENSGGGGHVDIDTNLIVDGNVGIGTSSPDQTGYGYKTLTIMGGTTAGYAGVLELLTPSTDANGQNLGIVSFGSGGTRNALIGAVRQSGNNNAKLQFWTAAGANGIENRMTIDADGQVGIGTDSPTANLHVQNASTATLKVITTGVADASVNIQGYDAGVHIGDATNGLRWAIWNDGPSTSSSLKFGSYALGTWYNDGSQVVTMKSDGKVGIGTPSPSTLLHLNKPTAGDAMLTIQSTSSGDPGITMITTNDRTGNIFYKDGSAASTQRKFTYDHAAQAFKMFAHNTTVADFYASETLAYFPTQNVGIGTTSPTSPTSVARFLEISGATAGIVLHDSDVEAWDLYASGGKLGTRYNNGANGWWLDSSGRMGIGTTSPGAQLHNYSTAATNVFITGHGTAAQNDWGAQNCMFVKTDNGLLISKANAANNTNRIFNFYNDANGYAQLYMHAGATANVKIQASGNSYFNGGNVGIGDTQPTSLSVNTSSLSVNSTRTDLSGALFQKSNGVLKFQQYWSTAGIVADVSAGDYFWKLANVNKMALDTGTGALTVVGDVVAYGSPSDKRLKENIKPIESALDKVSKLQGVTFDWKKSDSILKIKQDIGFIAQDVQKVVPGLVRENENGMLSMRHQGIAPILLEAIKELKAEIEELKKYKCDCKK